MKKGKKVSLDSLSLSDQNMAINTILINAINEMLIEKGVCTHDEMSKMVSKETKWASKTMSGKRK